MSWLGCLIDLLFAETVKPWPTACAYVFPTTRIIFMLCNMLVGHVRSNFLNNIICSRIFIEANGEYHLGHHFDSEVPNITLFI